MTHRNRAQKRLITKFTKDKLLPLIWSWMSSSPATCQAFEGFLYDFFSRIYAWISARNQYSPHHFVSGSCNSWYSLCGKSIFSLNSCSLRDCLTSLKWTVLVVAEKNKAKHTYNFSQTAVWYVHCTYYTFSVPWSLIKQMYTVQNMVQVTQIQSCFCTVCILYWIVLYIVICKVSGIQFTPRFLPIKMVGRDHNLCVKLSLDRPESSMCLD